MTTMNVGKSRPNNPAANISAGPGRQSQFQSRGDLTHDVIALRAYEIWERSGRPDGQSDQYWFQAEAELRRPRPS